MVGRRNISISDEAYERLTALKRPKESFMDVINRLSGKRSILELAGILSKEEARGVRNSIGKIRAGSTKRVHSERVEKARSEFTKFYGSLAGEKGVLKELAELKRSEREKLEKKAARYTPSALN